MLWVTRRGAYISADGLAYVGTARNLLHGHGFRPPPGSPSVSNFPPLYPLVLAGIGVFGPDPVTVARYVNPVIFGATILLIGLLTLRLTGSRPLALGAQLAALGGTDFLAYHSSALSEPLFVLLALLALAAVEVCRVRARPAVLVAGALLAGAACLTRYVGVAVVAAGVIALLAQQARAGTRRVGQAVVFAAVGMAPLAGWVLWLRHSTGQASDRTAVVHVPGASYVSTGLQTASGWVLPTDVGWPVREAAAALVIVLLAIVAWRRRSHLPLAFVLFSVLYVAALVADRSLFDVTGRLDERFLLPLHAAAIAVALAALRGVDLTRAHVARIGLSLVVGLQLVGGALWVHDAVTDPAVRPGGFADPAWNGSELVSEVQALPASTPVYTNEVDALWFQTHRVAMPVPEKNVFLTGRPNGAYQSQIAAMQQALRAGGYLVYFTATPSRRAFLPTPDELATSLQLQVVTRDAIGTGYRAAATP